MSCNQCGTTIILRFCQLAALFDRMSCINTLMFEIKQVSGARHGQTTEKDLSKEKDLVFRLDLIFSIYFFSLK